MSELTPSVIKKLKVTELKSELAKRNLSLKGKKDELVLRLIDFINNGSESKLQSEDNENEDIDSSNANLESSEDSSQNTLNDSQQEFLNDDIAEENQFQKMDDSTVTSESEKNQSHTTETSNNEAESMDTNETKSDAINLEPSEEKVETVDNQKEKDEDWVMVEPLSIEEVKEAESSVSEGKLADRSSHENFKEEQKQEVKLQDKLVEVEEESDAFQEVYHPPEDIVALDGYTNDLHFVISGNGLFGHTLVKNGFSYLWAGARANKGAKSGKVGYEVKILAAQPVDLPANETPIHAVRIGWSSEQSSLQLGESTHSYGFESTGKVCASSKFFNYGESYKEGDVIGTYLDLESEPKTLKYTKNGKDLGVAVSLTKKEEKPLFPQLFLRNMKVEINFGSKEESWHEPLEGYKFIQNVPKENLVSLTYKYPETRESCEVIMMVGLPNAGKSNWVRKYRDSHPEKLYNVIGVTHILERCLLSGNPRKKTDEGHEAFMKNVIRVLAMLYKICPKTKRNYIYDQNNVYKIAQITKMEAFTGFKRKAVVVVPTHDNLRKRTSDSKRKADGYLHDVPFGDLCDMKCNFHIPEVGEIFSEVVYPELDERNATKTVSDYKSDGERAKRTGRDENYQRKRSRNDDRNYGRDRFNNRSRDRRDDGWKKSGSGYGVYSNSPGAKGNQASGFNKNVSNQGSGFKRGRDSQDRRHGGIASGGGGYRQNSSYGSSYGKSGGGSYRGSSGNYGSSGGGSYGSNYGSYGNSYSSGGYGSGGSYGGYGSSYNQTSSRTGSGQGGWSQSGGSYNLQPSTNQWGSSSGQWGSGYNSNNSYSSNYNNGNSYGGW
ncbi:heterogeneous nuclear ribonucleoprotein U isoform X1 [Hydra vulgaris]|uniref:Heterogeneous nuclear ribonucleoprotein U isoform X1 n=2 Tax=Hydra vulgaris TaxID=6087 RepID=A0ABM4C0L3_HYDVU